MTPLSQRLWAVGLLAACLAACAPPLVSMSRSLVCRLQPGDGGAHSGQFGTVPPWLHEQFQPAPQAATDAAGIQLYVCP